MRLLSSEGCTGQGSGQDEAVIASIAFHNFKALRSASVRLERFNLLIGPNGSGKSSLIEGIMRMGALARLPASDLPVDGQDGGDRAEVRFQFMPPFAAWEVVMRCATRDACDALQWSRRPDSGDGPVDWEELRSRLQRVRRYEFEHAAMVRGTAVADDAELAPDGGNLAAVMHHRRTQHQPAYDRRRRDVLRALPEYDQVSAEVTSDGRAFIRLRLVEEGELITHEELSHGSLCALAIFCLSTDPEPPSVLCIEDLDRGLHPRLLREARDALYRLSHPGNGEPQAMRSQIVATTHSPYLLDLFREHPEEVVVAEKHGRASTFRRLCDCPDLSEMMAGVSLGDLWYSGVIGGVPEEPESTSSAVNGGSAP